MKKNIVIAALVVALVSALFGTITGAGTAFTAMLLVGSFFGGAGIACIPTMLIGDIAKDVFKKDCAVTVFAVLTAVSSVSLFAYSQVTVYEANQDAMTWEEVGEFKGSFIAGLGGYAEDEDGNVYVIKDLDKSAFSSVYNQVRRAEGLSREAAYAKACNLEDNGKIIACEEQSERDYKVVSRSNGKKVLLSRPAQHNNK